ncbi:MAG TPA: phosphatase PAP2 family protein [Solirubrobacteraceae bacterium]
MRKRVGLAALAVLAIYIVAVGTAPGRHLDVLLIRYDFGSGLLYRGAEYLLGAITWLTVGASGLAIALWACRRHGLGRACRILAGLAATYLSALALSLALQRVDPLGGEARRVAGSGYYPSGHAAMVAALAMAVVATAPAATRRILAVLAVAAVATVGVVIVVLNSHYPSDVLGGWALAFAWMTAAAPPWRCGD